MALAALTTIGSAYPRQTETFAPRSASVDVAALVQTITNVADTRSRDLSAPVSGVGATNAAARLTHRPQEAGISSPALAPDRHDPAFAADPSLIRALRTKSITEMENQLHGREIDPHLRLVSLAPPYALSGADSYQTRLAYVSARVERSLFDAGKSAGLSAALILELKQIFGDDIDFASDIRAGDSLSVIYEQKYWFGQKIADGPILAAEFINQGQAHRAIGFRDESGRLTYYTPNGRNLNRSFLRTPVEYSRISSRFSLSRFHPILKIWLPHLGVDYAAPIGTPVRATATGTIASIGWDGGYGRTIVVNHGGGYSTLYAHLSRYRAGLKSGAHVEQGKVIGYVGRSGLATGPHLHYEFRVKGRHRNPLAYDFPNDEPVPVAQRAKFSRAARAWATQLDRMRQRYVASR